MSDILNELGSEFGGQPRGVDATSSQGTNELITVDLDAKLDERLGWLARWQKVSQEELLARIIGTYPRHAEQRSVSVPVSQATATRLAAAAATVGMSEEALIAEAIDYYSPPENSPRTGRLVGLLGLLLVLPVALMFASPDVRGSASVAAWCIYAVAMLVCCPGAVGLVVLAIYAEWIVIKYRIAGLVIAAGYGMSAILSAFAYNYWLLSNLVPASFNLPMTRMDAVYFTLGTFTTTGTGRLSAQSSGAELLISCQVILGWSFVAVMVALVVPRVAAAYKRKSNGRLIVRIENNRPSR
jgi:voltage-gated potassium channel